MLRETQRQRTNLTSGSDQSLKFPFVVREREPFQRIRDRSFIASQESEMRGRSYSYSPSPPRGYIQRRRSPSPRGRYGRHGRDLPTSLLVRNIPHDCRPEDLRGPFGQFGPLKDVYLPRDYYTGVEDTNEVIRVLCWRQLWSNKSVVLKTPINK